MGETADLAEFTASTGYDDVPDDVIDHAKTAVLDYVGVALYGAHHEVGNKIYEYVDSYTNGHGATVFGRGEAGPPSAALANGAFGHAIDYDDTFESIVIHPTSPVFAASLAAGESADVSGEELLLGYVVGCEVAFRTGHSTYPEHYQNGWHSTGTVGTFGATAAAASILDLSTEEIERAFGIAASLSSSLKKNFGSMTKPLHAGHAAEMGVRAALLASNGFTSDPAVFEGDIGYGSVMTIDKGYDPEEITDGLGEQWAVSDIGFKPHPSGVITHAAMDAMRTLTIDYDLEPEDVEQVVVTLDDAASEMLIHAQPENALQAKFSIEFCLAAILREREAGIHEFTDSYVTEPETKQEVEKVERAFKENLFNDDFAGYGAVVRVITIDGEELVEEVRYAPGSPNNPVAEDRLRSKFYECAETQISSEDATELETLIDTLETEPLDRLRTLVSPKNI